MADTFSKVALSAWDLCLFPSGRDTARTWVVLLGSSLEELILSWPCLRPASGFLVLNVNGSF